MENGFPVYVRDLASVEDSHEEIRHYAKANMQDAVIMWLTKESGANTVRVVDTVTKELEKIKTILPPDIQIANVWDTSKLIRDSVERLRETAFWGGAIAFLVLLSLSLELTDNPYPCHLHPLCHYHYLHCHLLCGLYP